MANFMNISNFLEGVINTQLASARVNQGVWEWYNGLQRVMSQNRITGTSTIYGPAATPGSGTTTVVETVPVTLYGILIDNSMASEDVVIGLGNSASTPGTTTSQGLVWGVRNAITTVLIPQGNAFATKLEVYSMLGTNTGYEAGTDSTTQPTVVLVYAK